MKKVIIAYLFTKYDNKENIAFFVKNILKYKPGYPSKILICFKLLSKNEILIAKNYLKKIKCEIFIDKYKKNDFDFGSYKRIAKKYKDNLIFFCLGHAYPISNNWLKKIMNHYNNKTIIGTSASNESMLNSFITKKKIKLIFNIKKYLFFKKNFCKFPNPHIRTINFLIKGNEFLNFIKDKPISNKMDTWQIESGKSNLTNYFLSKNYKILIVNSEGKSFSINNFKESETYFYKNQKKSLFSDKHSRKFFKMSFLQKKIAQKKVWNI